MNAKLLKTHDICKMDTDKGEIRLKIGKIESCAAGRILLALMILLCSCVPLAARAGDAVFVPSKGQKAVRTSTDVCLVALPATALAVTLLERDWTGLKEGAISMGVTLGTTLLLKSVVKERRPDFSNRHSFPSGHASVTFAAATFIGRRYGWKYSIPAYAVSTYTAWGRVYGKKHHWWDVLTGAAIGTASSLAFTHPWMKKHEVAIVPTASETSAGLMASFSF